MTKFAFFTFLALSLYAAHRSSISDLTYLQMIYSANLHFGNVKHFSSSNILKMRKNGENKLGQWKTFFAALFGKCISKIIKIKLHFCVGNILFFAFSKMSLRCCFIFHYGQYSPLTHSTIDSKLTNISKIPLLLLLVLLLLLLLLLGRVQW